MPDSRKARRQSDPGLQPERTSLAWFRTLPGYAALLALAIRYNWQQTELPFWLATGILAIPAGIIWRYSRRRSRMDTGQDDFFHFRAMRDKFLISMALFTVALLFSTHLVWQIVYSLLAAG